MPEDAEQTLRRIVERTHAALLAATRDHSSVNGKLSERFQGCCGLAQCIAGYALQDAGITVRPIATQSLADYWHGHAALGVKIVDASSSRWFLVDPTFCQFCGDSTDDTAPSPGYHLRRSEEGERMLDELLTRGYIELTGEKAASYVAAFCRGERRLNPTEAFEFLTNPPSHPYHFKRDVDCDDFSRENLARRGLRIALPS